MKIRVIPPDKRLSALIKCFWTLEKGKAYHRERLFPNGELQFIFHYGSPFTETKKNGEKVLQPACLCCGQYSEYRDIVSDSSAGLIGVVFHPHTISTVLHIPARELYNTVADLSDIKKSYKTLSEMISEAPDTKARVRIIEQFLLKNISIPNLNNFKMIEESVRLLSVSSPKIPVEGMAKKYSISPRQFERIFSHYVGLSPRSYSTIVRFAKTLEMINGSSSLTDISYSAGYYDQSQFIRTFKEFTGYTPGEYRDIIIVK